MSDPITPMREALTRLQAQYAAAPRAAMPEEVRAAHAVCAHTDTTSSRDPHSSI